MDIKPSSIGLMNMGICISGIKRRNTMLEIAGSILLLTIAASLTALTIAIIVILFRK